MTFRFDLVLCSVSASCFGVMAITVKREYMCASPLSISCWFLWPFEINTPCSTLHSAAQCIWWWWWWWCIYSGGCDWANTFILSHTITWFYCLIFMSLKLCQSPCLSPSFFLLSTLTLPLLLLLSVLSTSTLSFPLHLTLSTHSLTLSLSHSPFLSPFLSLSLCCFDSDAVISLSILILSCQCSAVHSELQLPPSSLSLSPHYPPPFPSLFLSLSQTTETLMGWAS